MTKATRIPVVITRDQIIMWRLKTIAHTAWQVHATEKYHAIPFTRSGFARYCGSSCMAVKQPWRPKMAPQIPKAHPAGVISVG